jgi:hypothetical protein
VREVDDALGRQMVAAREAESLELEPQTPVVSQLSGSEPQEADLVTEGPEVVTEPPAKKARSRGR